MDADWSRVAVVADRLARAGCVAAADEAELMVTGTADATELEAWIVRREAGEPLPWIVGWTEFAGRRVRVDTGVYVPRWQSEELATRAAAALSDGGRAVDLCCGSGAIAAHLVGQVPSATVVAVDVDPRAVACARANGVAAVVGDLDAPLSSTQFDVVTAVAPYVPTAELAFLPRDVQDFEPRLALDGGDDGLDLVRRVIQAAGRLLRPGGSVFVEIGADQDRLLQPTLDAAGLSEVQTWRDEDGDLRGLSASR